LIEMDIPGLKRKLATVRHCVPGIERKIEDRSGKLTGVDQGVRYIIRQHRIDLDLLPERRPQQPGRIDDQRVDVDFTGLERLSASERQQALSKIGAARGCFIDQLRNRSKVRPIRQSLRQNLDRPDDDRENVVEIMSDTAGELSDRFHFLSLPNLRFGGLNFSNFLQHIFGAAALSSLLLQCGVCQAKLSWRRNGKKLRQ